MFESFYLNVYMANSNKLSSMCQIDSLQTIRSLWPLSNFWPSPSLLPSNKWLMAIVDKHILNLWPTASNSSLNPLYHYHRNLSRLLSMFIQSTSFIFNIQLFWSFVTNNHIDLSDKPILIDQVFSIHATVYLLLWKMQLLHTHETI